MDTLSNQTIQLIGGFVLAAVLVIMVSALAMMEIEVPDALDRALYVVLGSFLGVNAVNGIRKINGGK